MIQFQSKGFYKFLVSVLSILIALNIFSAVVYQNLLFALSIAFVAVVLYSVLTKKSWSKTIVKVWATLLMISGIAKVLATALRVIDYNYFDGATALQEIVWSDVFVRTVLLIIGVIAYIFANKYMVVIDKDENITQTQEAT